MLLYGNLAKGSRVGGSHNICGIAPRWFWLTLFDHPIESGEPMVNVFEFLAKSIEHTKSGM